MRLLVRVGVLGAGIAAALAVGVPVAAAQAPEFTVFTYTTALGRPADVDLDIALRPQDAAPARIAIYVPQGYALAAPQPGAAVGTVETRIALAGQTRTVTGRIVADDPARHVTNACAPGLHASVLLLSLNILGGQLNIPLYVDPTTGPETALGAYRMQVCFASPYVPLEQGGAPGAARLVEASLSFPRLLTNPTARGIYRWRALVTPYTVGTATANLAATFELRSLAPLPVSVTLRARYDARRRQAVITGRFTATGAAVARAPVVVLGGTRPANLRVVGIARTNRRGAFTLRRRIRATSIFIAGAGGGSGACGPPASPAPAGCVRETLAVSFSNPVRVVVRRR